jgi:ferredoxin
MDPRYQELASKIMMGHSERIARLFSLLADETDADLLLAMPGQPADLAAKANLSEDEVQRRLDELFRKGLVFTSKKTDPPTYRMCRDMVQFHDASILWPEATQEFLDLWREFMNEEWYDLAATISKTVAKPFTRIIPVGITVEARQQILDFESVRDIVMNSNNLAVTNCTCRLTMRNCDRPLENCLQVNRAADYSITRGTGRQLTKDQALDLLDECEKAGLIHVTINRSEVDHFICNCCPCCCQTMPVLIEKGIRVVDPSRFRAEIDADACSGCGLCHDRCYFGAITWTDGEGSISQVDADKCMGCGLCLVTCPEEAITMAEIRPRDFVPGAA